MKRIIFSPLFLLIWVVICSVISFTLVRSLIRTQNAKGRVSSLEERNRELQLEVDGLRLQLEEANSSFSKEQIIRNELGLQLPGETIVQMEAAPESEGSQTATDEQKNEDELPWYERLFGLFLQR